MQKNQSFCGRSLSRYEAGIRTLEHEQAGSTKSPGAILDDAQRRPRRGEALRAE
jgi:hypothetical protein